MGNHSSLRHHSIAEIRQEIKNMDKKKILVVDDEEAIAEFIEINLVRSGFEVIKAFCGEEALKKIEIDDPDLVVLDIMMPDMDGFEVCKKTRKFSDVPIIMLTARDDGYDKVIGLEFGADDYMTKPFNPWELIARIQAILRRTAKKDTQSKDKKVRFGCITIDPMGRKVWKNEKLVELTPREYDILMLFSSNPGISFSRQEVRQKIWGHEFIEERSIDVHVRRLRDKIEDSPENPSLIMTIWGVGYKSNPDAFGKK